MSDGPFLLNIHSAWFDQKIIVTFGTNVFSWLRYVKTKKNTQAGKTLKLVDGKVSEVKVSVIEQLHRAGSNVFSSSLRL